MILWLDDVREPSPHGYVGAKWVKTYEAAITALESGEVTFASLDHDIGACAECTASGRHVGDMRSLETTFVNTCPHAKTGYDVVCWMEETGTWPKNGVAVHSMNPVGRQRMQQVIDKHDAKSQTTER